MFLYGKNLALPDRTARLARGQVARGL